MHNLRIRDLSIFPREGGVHARATAAAYRRTSAELEQGEGLDGPTFVHAGFFMGSSGAAAPRVLHHHAAAQLQSRSCCARGAGKQVLDVEGDVRDDWDAASDSQGAGGLEEADEELVGLEGELEAYFEELMGDESGTQPSLASDPEELGEEFLGADMNELWLTVGLNDTWHMDVAQIPGSFQRWQSFAQSDAAADESALLEAQTSGDSVWPAAVVLSRWMTGPPAPFDIRGKSVLELGSGLSLPGTLAARLGAEKVLLLDRMEEPLQQALRTAAQYDIVSRISTITMDWEEIPERFRGDSGDELSEFAQPDVILGADILSLEEWAEPVASALATLLVREEQVAYIMDPVQGSNVVAFREACQRHGLDVNTKEIMTWEEEDEDFTAEWVCQLVTVRRQA